MKFKEEISYVTKRLQVAIINFRKGQKDTKDNII